MDEKSITDLLSQLMPDSPEKNSVPDGEEDGEKSNILAESLKAIAGQSGGPLQTAVSEFLSGKGLLHETTSAAMTRSGSSGVDEIGTFLAKQFNLPPAIARLIAPLLAKLLPSTGKQTAKETPAKKKTRPKAKPKSTSRPKAKAKTSPKKPKKKETTRPKTTASKSAAKKKPAAKTAKKETSTKVKKKKTTGTN